MLARYAPASVVVNQDFEIQQFRGSTATFLEAPFGQPTTSILRMAKEGLFTALRSALAAATTAKVEVVREGLRVVAAGAEVEFTLRILPLTSAHTEETALLVLFETESSRVSSVPAAPAGRPSSDRDVAGLRQELSDSRERCPCSPFWTSRRPMPTTFGQRMKRCCRVTKSSRARTKSSRRRRRSCRVHRGTHDRQRAVSDTQSRARCAD